MDPPLTSTELRAFEPVRGTILRSMFWPLREMVIHYSKIRTHNAHGGGGMCLSSATTICGNVGSTYGMRYEYDCVLQ